MDYLYYDECTCIIYGIKEEKRMFQGISWPLAFLHDKYKINEIVLFKTGIMTVILVTRSIDTHITIIQAVFLLHNTV